MAVHPPRLRRGDAVRVIAPSLSRAHVDTHDHSALIEARFAALGLRLTYGEHLHETDHLGCAPVAARVADLHAAFADPGVAAVLTVIGGYNANDLLPHLDWDLIAAHPKVLCGYSDITALQAAILARTGLVTYSGPNWSSFGMRDHFERTLAWFEAAVFSDAPIVLHPADAWTDDAWFADQDARDPIPSEGWWRLQAGAAEGRVVGGNLCTLNLLQGTPYMPSLTDALLMLEDDGDSDAPTFARDLTSLLQLPDAADIRGLVIGRFQRESAMTRALLEEIVAAAPQLRGVPVLANADFGHTSPMFTLPIGGWARMDADGTDALTFVAH